MLKGHWKILLVLSASSAFVPQRSATHRSARVGGARGLPTMPAEPMSPTQVAPETKTLPMSSFMPPFPPTGRPNHLADLTYPIKTLVATEDDLAAVVELRLDVFTAYPDSVVRRRMATRALKKLLERRKEGSICVAAKVGGATCGSLELSWHEFLSCGVDEDPSTPTEEDQTYLSVWGRKMAASPWHSRGAWPRASNPPGAPRRQEPPGDGGFAFRPHGQRLYITEVAVSGSKRRRGVGLKLIREAERLVAGNHTQGVPFGGDISGRPMASKAKPPPDRPSAPELYLHVEDTNFGAIEFYLRAGFTLAPETPETVRFTERLGLTSGIFESKRHVLMVKRVGVVATRAPKGGDSQLATSPLVDPAFSALGSEVGKSRVEGQVE
mmetsp:Transcript_35687/g.80468  ORF Transcript_35687/g.80468 Transcript_35687/m.80468 type:complete len:382 (-) Transcript_35687:216-1361(-)